MRDTTDRTFYVYNIETFGIVGWYKSLVAATFMRWLLGRRTHRIGVFVTPRFL